ncbi:hypothetical protein FACS1894161_2030 [Spirochaetia bacterium]|nr:hypothetical protein FACS1894161_2030 [Spirochaetia bacterium]
MDTTLKDKLLFPRRNASDVLSAGETGAADEYCRGYIEFLNAAKTEREAVSAAAALAEKRGVVSWKAGMKPQAGTKIYFSRRGKALILCAVGKKPLEEGISIIAAHIDSPRLDLKMAPIYEDSGMAFFDTHYYGGIKPYQWTGIPLAIHGFVIRGDGKEISISIGEDPRDPCFFIADLLPHLAEAQMKKPAGEAVKTEDLDILAGLRLAPGESGPGAVKLNILPCRQGPYRPFFQAVLPVIKGR